MDALLSVRLVTADGQIIEASEEANADLFWAIRGAGANFGIILSATYQLFPPTNDNEIVIVETTFAAQQNVSYYEALEVVTRTPVPELSLNAVTVWDETTNSVSLCIMVTHISLICTLPPAHLPFAHLKKKTKKKKLY